MAPPAHLEEKLSQNNLTASLKSGKVYILTSGESIWGDTF